VTDGPWIRETLERFEGRLVQYAKGITGDLEEARDVVQETFVKLCAQRREDVEAHVGRWLYAVCRNQALDVRRKGRAMSIDHQAPGLERADAGRSPAAEVETREEGSRALALLATLPEKQREVLRLKFQAGLSYKEICEVTGHSIGNVGYLVHVGLKSLRSRLGLSAVQEGGAS
jgi:RNA polymerase sigma-70 factor (ECF subfamily)